MESYDARLKFFTAHPQYLAPVRRPNQSIEQAFVAFNRDAFSLAQIDPIKSGRLSPAINLRLQYSEEIDGVGIVKTFMSFVIKSEKTSIESNLKTLITNRIDKIERELKSSEAAYEANTSAAIADLLEKDNIKTKILHDEMKALRQQLKTRRQNRIKELDEAISIAKQLGIKKPSTPSSLADSVNAKEGASIRTEVNNRQIPLYFMGESALEAERSTLISRRSDDFTEPRIDDIQKELSLLNSNRQVDAFRERENKNLFLNGFGDWQANLTRLKNIQIDFDQFELVRIDEPASEPRSPVKPRKALVIGLGLSIGFSLGSILALARRLGRPTDVTRKIV